MNRAEAMAEPEEPTPAIAEYVGALLERWPDITGDAGEDSPWSDEFGGQKWGSPALFVAGPRLS